jgi:hypothetical protein
MNLRDKLKQGLTCHIHSKKESLPYLPKYFQSSYVLPHASLLLLHISNKQLKLLLMNCSISEWGLQAK